MPASAAKSPRNRMVSTPTIEIMMPPSWVQVRRTPNNNSDHSATNSGPED